MTAAPPKTRTASTRRTKILARGMEVDPIPAESRKRAACVLEVLAGLRSPEDAAEALGISVPGYYQLETRALRSLVHGCTREPPGRKAALEKRLREVEAQGVDLTRQVQRYRALLRNAQRTAGVLAEPKTPKTRPTQASQAARAGPACDQCAEWHGWGYRGEHENG